MGFVVDTDVMFVVLVVVMTIAIIVLCVLVVVVDVDSVEVVVHVEVAVAVMVLGSLPSLVIVVLSIQNNGQWTFVLTMSRKSEIKTFKY